MKKKEQFSIALWDRLQKDNIPHEFETRGGSRVTQVIKFEGNLKEPIVGVSENDTESWSLDGIYNEIEGSGDLFIVWEEEQLMLEGWINIYPKSLEFATALFHPTKEKADKQAKSNRIACVKVSIPYTKGEGLNNG